MYPSCGNVTRLGLYLPRIPHLPPLRWAPSPPQKSVADPPADSAVSEPPLASLATHLPSGIIRETLSRSKSVWKTFRTARRIAWWLFSAGFPPHYQRLPPILCICRHVYPFWNQSYPSGVRDIATLRLPHLNALARLFLLVEISASVVFLRLKSGPLGILGPSVDVKLVRDFFKCVFH